MQVIPGFEEGTIGMKVSFNSCGCLSLATQLCVAGAC